MQVKGLPCSEVALPPVVSAASKDVPLTVNTFTFSLHFTVQRAFPTTNQTKADYKLNSTSFPSNCGTESSRTIITPQKDLVAEIAITVSALEK